MGFLTGVAAPAIEGVIEQHPSFELFEIVGVHPRETERNGEQARCFRREVEARGVGGPHDGGQPAEGVDREAKLLDHDVESAELAAVAPEDIGVDIER